MAAMAMIMATDIIVIPIATSTTVIDIPTEITIVTGMTIVDHGMTTTAHDEPTGQAHPPPQEAVS
jgi:hypothetical protein